MAISPGGRPINYAPLSSSTTDNWVARAGGLPPYVRGVARGIAKGGKVTSRAIKIAISRMVVWAAGGDNVHPAVQAAAAAALAQWRAMTASHGHVNLSRAVEWEEYVDLAAINKHHVKGTAYHWKHDYIPLDAYTALKWKKNKAAAILHAAGKFHAEEPKGFGGPHELPHPTGHVLGKDELPKPTVETPKAPPETADWVKAAQTKALARFTKEQKAKYAGRFNARFALHSRYSDSELAHAVSLGDDKAVAHTEAREWLKAKGYGTGKDVSTLAFYETARAKSYLANKKILDAREARARLKAETESKGNSAEAQAAITAHHVEANARSKATGRMITGPAAWSVEDLEKAIALGDASAIPYLENAKRRAAKQAKADAVIAARQGRAARQNAEGDAVSKALDIEGLPKSGRSRAGVEHGMEMIDKVHGDGKLVPIPVKKTVSNEAYGIYDPNKGGSIRMREANDHHSLTFVHEVGHWLDNTVLGEDESRQKYRWNSETRGKEYSSAVGHASSRYASSMSHEPEWEAFRKAIDESAPIQMLKTAYTNRDGVNKKTLLYYLSRHEEWARAYSQYIAESSASPTMAAELKEFIDARDPGAVNARPTGYTQWTPEEFAPIKAAIDAILKAKGWKS